MAQCAVIADDLTGANATGVLLTKMHYKTATVLSLDNLTPDLLAAADCVLYPTDSRAIAADLAYERVRRAMDRFAGKDIRLFSKRIDSTLRGNLGPETDAMLDALGKDSVAVCAPCFPSAGRIVVGGYMLVEGVPLHRTSIAIDPKTPVRVSEVEALFRDQSRYRVASFSLDDMMEGPAALRDRVLSAVESGFRILTFDCVSQEDLDLIADAVLPIERPLLAVDPGVFTATLARRLIRPRRGKQSSRILTVVGSVNPHTRDQMEQVFLRQDHFNVFVSTRSLLESDKEREAEIGRVVAAVLKAPSSVHLCCVTGDGLYPENRIDFTPYMERYQCSLDAASGMINDAFAEITWRILQKDSSFSGIYTSGGDVTQAVCRWFRAAGLDLHGEVLPLAAYGRFMGGDFNGLPIVTKGGSQGGPDAINQCINYLRERLRI